MTFRDNENGRIEPPIFIVGCMRSGTSLISHVLNNHSRIAVFYESYLYNYFRSELRYYGDLNDSSNLRRLIANVRRAIAAQKVVPPTSDEIESTLATRTFPGVLESVLHLHAHSRGKKRAGDKTPDHHLCLPQIMRDFPASPVVFVMRDPRDTALSYRKAFGSALEVGARAWNDAFESYSNARESVILLRYEELARAPQPTIEALCQAIGEEFEPGMLRFFERIPKRLRGEERHKKLTRPIDTSSVGTFRQLSYGEIETIESICAEGMAAMDFAFSTARKRKNSFSQTRRTSLRKVLDRLQYYRFDTERWKAGLVRWKMMLGVRLPYWFAFAPVRTKD
jgi:Sulfotransferase family